MGNDIGVKCTTCGFEDILSVGGGIGPWFRNPSIDTLVEIVSKKEARILLALQENQNGVISGFPTQTYYTCPKCNTLHSNLFYEVNYDGNKKYTKEYHCEKCGTPLTLLPLEDELDISRFHCKKCGRQSLIDSGIKIMWD